MNRGGWLCPAPPPCQYGLCRHAKSAAVAGACDCAPQALAYPHALLCWRAQVIQDGSAPPSMVHHTLYPQAWCDPSLGAVSQPELGLEDRPFSKSKYERMSTHRPGTVIIHDPTDTAHR